MAVAVANPTLDLQEHLHSFNPDAPEFKPVNDHKLRPEAAEFIPTAGGWATLQIAVDAYAQRAQRQMPPATDEEWDQRIAKREKEVETIKLLQSYRLYIDAIPKASRTEGDDEPRTPDPRDRSISKRMWKWNVEKWRLELKGRCVYPRETLLACWTVVQADKEVMADKDGEGTGLHAVSLPVVASAPLASGSSKTSSSAIAIVAPAQDSGKA